MSHLKRWTSSLSFPLSLSSSSIWCFSSSIISARYLHLREDEIMDNLFHNSSSSSSASFNWFSARTTISPLDSLQVKACSISNKLKFSGKRTSFASSAISIQVQYKFTRLSWFVERSRNSYSFSATNNSISLRISSWKRDSHNKNPTLRMIMHHEGKVDVSDTESSAWRRVSYEIIKNEEIELMLSSWMMIWDENILFECIYLSISL